MESRRRATHGLTVVGVVVGLGVATAGVWSSTSAAFTAGTRNPDNVWTAGTLQLSDDGTALALLDAGDLRPGWSRTRCIEVSDDGNLDASQLRLYATGHQQPLSTTDPDGLAPYLTLLVERDDSGSVPDCTGFVTDAVVFSGTAAELGSVATSFDTGVGGLTTGAAGGSYGYRITATLQDDPAAEDTSLTMGLVWEMRR